MYLSGLPSKFSTNMPFYDHCRTFLQSLASLGITLFSLLGITLLGEYSIAIYFITSLHHYVIWVIWYSYDGNQ